VITDALAHGAAAAFRALSSARGARIFHPRGAGYRGTLRVRSPVPGYAGVPLLSEPGEHEALMRLSRGAGLPAPLPDVLGLSVRLVDVHGPGRHQDFLLVTSLDAPLLHHVLLPTWRGALEHTYSSVLPYRVGEALRLVGACPAPAGAGLGFRLALAPLGGRWSAVADVEAGERLSDEETERLAFTPWNTGGGIRPAGALNALRRASYRGSQAGRGPAAGEIP
jgi:hypothetical protein